MPSSRGSSQPKSLLQVDPMLSASREAQEYLSGKSSPSSRDRPNSGIEPESPALQADSLPAELPGKLP